MNNLAVLEKYFKKYISDLAKWAPEGIINVDLELLHNFRLLNYHKPSSHDPNLTRYFHVLETEEKITLVNEQYVVWIVPEKVNNLPVTYTLIAINNPEYPKLELVFSTQGVYNTSKLVLRVLEKYLYEIQENEDLITKYSH